LSTNFARGFCRWGQNCRFLHDRKSAHICRFFQRGFCSYGERRWGSPPGRALAAVAQGWGGAQRSSAHPVPNMTHMAFKFASLAVEEDEKDKDNIPAPDNVPGGAAQRTGMRENPALAFAPDPNPPPSTSGLWKALLAAFLGWGPELLSLCPPLSSQPASLMVGQDELFPSKMLKARSENVVCGICMDRVYEKRAPNERYFGILPNCSHAYCVGCIRKWRRSRDFQSTVIKACPECRVTSSYYIPNKYWISDVDEKKQLIENFRARTGKIRCKFFVQNQGHCPFNSECLYLHELPPNQLPQRAQQLPSMTVVRGPSAVFLLSPPGGQRGERSVGDCWGGAAGGVGLEGSEGLPVPWPGGDSVTLLLPRAEGNHGPLARR
uniref:RING-type E3 ubiquitin transferase n=1 Tax=Athene cunicularia TaxID=194338 RepID=A0A663MDP5_ATHCN